MGDDGLELDYVSVYAASQLRQAADSRAAESGAVGAFSGCGGAPIDPDLAAVIDAWPALPDSVKASILARLRRVQAALEAAGE